MAMNRRDFLRLTSLAGMSLSLPAFPKLGHAASLAYEGPFWVTIHAAGGWDPTLLCDPKGRTSQNQPEPVNHYFVDEILEIGPFRVAPVNGHSAFFERFQEQLLVVNGIDVGTNSHEVGTRHIWSGSINPGTPSISALVAGARDEHPALPFLSNGGYDMTGGVVAPTRIPDTAAITEIAYPERLNGADPATQLYTHETLSRLKLAREARLHRLSEKATLPRVKKALSVLHQARSGQNELARLTEFLPESLDNSGNNLVRQSQIAMAAFRAGVCVSANLSIGGFDTHGNHDAQHTPRMQQIIEGATFVMDEAERLGIADKIVLLVGSDFARTPYYNDSNGKDHWSVTSMMMMGPGIQGGRVIGATTEQQSPRRVNPQTLALDENGIRMTPGHIHGALRQVAGIDTRSELLSFPVGAALPIFEA